MASSSYWYDLMCEYSKKKRNAEGRKEEYQSFLKKLEKVNADIPTASNYLSQSESKFRSGGYFDGGTPDRGKIKECVSKLDALSTTMTNVVNKTSLKLSEYEKNIINYTNLYEDARNNWEMAKKEEAAAIRNSFFEKKISGKYF